MSLEEPNIMQDLVKLLFWIRKQVHLPVLNINMLLIVLIILHSIFIWIVVWYHSFTKKNHHSEWTLFLWYYIICGDTWEKKSSRQSTNFVFLHKVRSSRRLGALYGCFPPTRFLFKAEVFYTKSAIDTVYILLSDKCLWGIYRLLISSHVGLNILSSIVTHQYKAK